MVGYQIAASLRRRSMQFAFLFMMAAAVGYPVFLFYNRYFRNMDIGTVPDPRYAFLFHQHSLLLDYIPVLFPILSMFPAAASYCVDHKTHYSHAVASRCGIYRYLLANAAAALIGGFLIIFLPSLLNIGLNYLFLPRTTNSVLYNDYYTELYELIRVRTSEECTDLELLWYFHPVLSDFLTAVRFGVYMSVLSLITYVTAVCTKPKLSYAAIIPSFAFTTITRYLWDYTDLGIPLVPYTFASGTDNTLVFWITMSALILISMFVLKFQLKKDII